MIQPTLIDLHPDEYTVGLRYYPFAVNLDRCRNKWIIQNYRNKWSEILTKHISCKTVPTKTVATNFNKEGKNIYILLIFLLISIALLIAVTIYCCLIKYPAKHTFPFHVTNDKSKEVLSFMYYRNGE